MAHQLEGETDKFFTVRDGKGTFRVAKAGLSQRMIERIRKMGVKRKADGGELVPAQDFSDLPSGQAAYPGGRTPPPPVDLSAFPNMDPEAVAATRALDAEYAKLGVPGAPDPAATIPAGFVRQGTKAAEEMKAAAQQQPPPVPPPGGGAGVAIPKVGVRNVAMPEVPVADAEGFSKMQAAKLGAEETAINVGKLQGLAEGAKAAGYQQAEESAAIQRAEWTAKAQQHAQEYMDKANAITQEISNINATVDPGRFWASRSTAGKISAIVGLALGALGGGTDGVNRAATLLQQAIDRDIEAQKAEFQARMQKGQMQAGQARSMYEMQRNIAHDDLQAINASKATAYALADAQFSKAIAATKDPAARAQLMAAQARAQEDALKFNKDAQAQSFDRGMERAKLGTHMAGLQLEAQKANQAAMLHGMGAGAGAGTVAPTKEQLKSADEMLTHRNELKRQLGIAREQLGSLGIGTSFSGTSPAAEKYKAAVGAATLAAVKAGDPTSIASLTELKSKADEMGIQGGQIFVSQDTIRALMDQALNSADAKIKDVYGRYGLPLPKDMQEQEASGTQKPNMANYEAAMKKAQQ